MLKIHRSPVSQPPWFEHCPCRRMPKLGWCWNLWPHISYGFIWSFRHVPPLDCPTEIPTMRMSWWFFWHFSIHFSGGCIQQYPAFFHHLSAMFWPCLSPEAVCANARWSWIQWLDQWDNWNKVVKDIFSTFAKSLFLLYFYLGIIRLGWSVLLRVIAMSDRVCWFQSWLWKSANGCVVDGDGFCWDRKKTSMNDMDFWYL